MRAFFLDSMWRQVRKPRISINKTPMEIHDSGNAVEVVSKVKGSDAPEIWAVAPTEKSRSIAIPVRIRTSFFIMKRI